jgi:cytoskeleton protein RodZ
VQIINTLEAEQYDRIGYGVYLRGYLNSYARLVDVPTVLVDRLMGEHNHAPPLVTSGTISHSRYLYQRYSVSALYLILTGVIIVPAVLLAMRASLQPTISQLTPLEAPASSSPPDAMPATAAVNESPKSDRGTGGAAAADATSPVASNPDAPLVASLAPFSALSHKDPATHAETTAPVSGGHTVKLILKEASWVEVTSASGEKLEYGLLSAGSERTYATTKPLDVRLGNSNGAEVEIDGKAQDLAPYRRANVAHFKVFSAGEPISHSDG